METSRSIRAEMTPAALVSVWTVHTLFTNKREGRSDFPDGRHKSDLLNSLTILHPVARRLLGIDSE